MIIYCSPLVVNRLMHDLPQKFSDVITPSKEFYFTALQLITD